MVLAQARLVGNARASWYRAWCSFGDEGHERIARRLESVVMLVAQSASMEFLSTFRNRADDTLRTSRSNWHVHGALVDLPVAMTAAPQLCLFRGAMASGIDALAWGWRSGRVDLRLNDRVYRFGQVGDPVGESVVPVACRCEACPGLGQHGDCASASGDGSNRHLPYSPLTQSGDESLNVANVKLTGNVCGDEQA